MRKLLNAAGYGTGLAGLILTLGAAGCSDTGTDRLEAVIIRLAVGLALIGLGSLLTRAASFCGRADE